MKRGRQRSHRLDKEFRGIDGLAVNHGLSQMEITNQPPVVNHVKEKGEEIWVRISKPKPTLHQMIMNGKMVLDKLQDQCRGIESSSDDSSLLSDSVDYNWGG
ncbi:hypothetical protein QYF36_013017 [Acer negundo]|nr:hypothetical protein QYF36_013017 [Acer negundo]